MLVESMTTIEQIKEVQKCYFTYAKNKSVHLCFDYAKKRKKRKIEKTKEYYIYYETVSPQKNKWLFLINKGTEHKAL